LASYDDRYTADWPAETLNVSGALLYGAPVDRFRGTISLFGHPQFDRIRASSVAVVGLGGVGSWTVEALARTGVGRLILVDFDEVCISNINRQIQAVTETIGRPKVDVLAERLTSISPHCEVVVVRRFFSTQSCDEIFSLKPDVVIDAIDRVTNKTLLIAEASRRGVPIVSTGAAGGRSDPSEVRVEDLARTEHDRLLAFVRKKLRQDHGFPRSRKKLGIPCVYAPHQRNDEGPLFCAQAREGARATCNDGMGTAVFVTGVIGFVAAEQAIRLVLAD
jgi:tRNA A37 threonylcarbamoyladenosine dehydratase